MTTSSSVEPAWLTYARSQIGVRETPGPANNPTIMGWIKRLGTKVLGVLVTDDATPWCSTFAAHVVQEVGIDPPLVAVRASSWDRWGVPLTKMYMGAIVRFQRPGGGHVGLLTGVSRDGSVVYVLGGNQGDRVSITRIESARMVAIRWPAGMALPTILAPVLVTSAGAISRNEA